jgi:two-component system, NarL family, invasion response regulator UvrY
MIRVLVCDDHEIVRSGIRLIVSETNDIEVIDEAKTGQEALEKSIKNDYDVVLLDITFPDRNGLDVLKQLLVQKPKTKVLVLSIHPEDQYALRVIKAGARGYITKSTLADDMINAIRRVAGGGRYATASTEEILFSMLETGAYEKNYEQLSDREYQVMCLLAAGKTSKEIARSLSLSPNSIRTYRDRIMKKMEFGNITDLVRYVMEHKLLS